ncbi:MAG TPA: AAA family ATPase [Candidatus Saccharimonadales bacterium]|nr:AAA family ATPase [Candidatus Saccharimonadales bacterium]
MTQILTLVSNIDLIKERSNSGEKATPRDNEITIAVLENDLKSRVENPIFYAYRYGMLYNPNDDFAPDVKGGQRIKGQHIIDYTQMLDEAKKIYKEKLEKERGNNSPNNSGEIAGLKQLLEQKETRIQEQTARITELLTNKPDEKPNGQIEQLQQMIDTMAKMQSQRIEIKINNSTKVIDKVVHEKFADILSLLAVDEAVYLYGPAGTGKSELAKQFAKTLEIEFCPMSTLTQEFKLHGFIDGNGVYHETNFYKAFVNGGLFFLDEMDSCSSDVLVGINGALANGYYDFPNGTEYAHKDFRVIAAGNTIGRGGNESYTGRQALDISTLDRFLAVELNYSPAIDNAVAKNDIELIEFAHEIRNAAETSGIIILCSYRSISKIVKLQDMNFDLKDIMRMALIKGIASDDIKMLSRNMNINPTNKYFKALKQAA